MARVNIDKTKFEAMLDNPECESNTKREGERIKELAKGIFIADRVDPRHVDYEHSFVVEMDGRKALVGNTDDTSFFVEFGVYNGTRLGYAPLRRGLDAASID